MKTPHSSPAQSDPQSPSAFWARVQDKLGERTFMDVERATKLKYHMLHANRRRGSLLKESDARMLANYLGVSLDWLSQGVGPETAEPTEEVSAMAAVVSRLPQEDLKLLLGLAKVFARANGIEIPRRLEGLSDPSGSNEP